MGKVKELWQAERDKKLEEWKQGWLDAGYSVEDAEEFAVERLEEEDAANGQFGAGA